MTNGLLSLKTETPKLSLAFQAPWQEGTVQGDAWRNWSRGGQEVTWVPTLPPVTVLSKPFILLHVQILAPLEPSGPTMCSPSLRFLVPSPHHFKSSAEGPASSPPMCFIKSPIQVHYHLPTITAHGRLSLLAPSTLHVPRDCGSPGNPAITGPALSTPGEAPALLSTRPQARARAAEGCWGKAHGCSLNSRPQTSNWHSPCLAGLPVFPRKSIFLFSEVAVPYVLLSLQTTLHSAAEGLGSAFLKKLDAIRPNTSPPALGRGSLPLLLQPA